MQFLSGCKKFVSVGTPPTQIIEDVVFNDDATAMAAINGIYSRMMQSTGFASGGLNSIATLNGLSSDEFINYSNSFGPFYSNALLPSDVNINSYFWSEPYRYIYTANSILSSLSKSTAISNAAKLQIGGEAKFIRAFCYFYLVNEFGDVPLHLSGDYRVNNISNRTGTSEVYAQIITDLKDAQILLQNNYNASAGEKTKPSRFAVTALLARVYLYTKDWVNAEIQSDSIIANTLFSLSSLNNVFLKNSTEAIWQLRPVLPGYNTSEGRYYILTSQPLYVSLSNSIMNAFENNDLRKTNWVGSVITGTGAFFYPLKYKLSSGTVLNEYSMVLRLSEQYLIRAEARLLQNDIMGAQLDLNIIRNRAGLPNTTANTLSPLMDAIMHERQVELFSEWGHRWLDLKRTNTAVTVLNILKSSTWKPTAVLYPIPQIEITNNSNISQNPGY